MEMLEWGKEILKLLAGYLVGNFAAKRKQKQERLDERINSSVQLVREVVDQAVRYFTIEMDDRERGGTCAIIANNMKRISSELARLARCCGEKGDFFSQEHRRFFDAVTADPFGADKLDVVRHDHIRIKRIQETERFLIQRIQLLEQG